MAEDKAKTDASRISRRSFLTSTVTAAASVPFLTSTAEAHAIPPSGAPDGILVELTVNSRNHQVRLDPRTTLLDALRERLALTGTKKGCDHGQCGACTVHIGGQRVLACLTLAATVREPVTTIEGVAEPDGTLHPMQKAFIEQDAFQCGYCTPGQILSAIACVKEGHAGTGDEIREWMSGNLCRCAAYPHIVTAVQQAREELQGARS